MWHSRRYGVHSLSAPRSSYHRNDALRVAARFPPFTAGRTHSLLLAVVVRQAACVQSCSSSESVATAQQAADNACVQSPVIMKIWDADLSRSL